jgi:hypothetical protein
MFKIIPKSMITESQVIEQERKNQLFNILTPLFQGPPELFLKPAEQILKANDEDPDDWLPDAWIQFKEQGNKPPLFVQNPQVGPDGQPIQGQSMQAQAGTTPNQGAQKVVPQQQMGGVGKIASAVKGLFNR